MKKSYNRGSFRHSMMCTGSIRNRPGGLTGRCRDHAWCGRVTAMRTRPCSRVRSAAPGPDNTSIRRDVMRGPGSGVMRVHEPRDSHREATRILCPPFTAGPRPSCRSRSVSVSLCPAISRIITERHRNQFASLTVTSILRRPRQARNPLEPRLTHSFLRPERGGQDCSANSIRTCR